MQKKVFTIMIMSMIIISSFGVFGLQNTDENNIKTMELKTMYFTEPTIIESKESTTIEINDINTKVMTPGHPMVPKAVELIELPFGVQNVQVQITPKSVQEYTVTKELAFAPTPIPLSSNYIYEQGMVTSTKDVEVYSTDAFYPNEWCSYNVGVGLNKDMKRVTHVAIHSYPVRYNPVEGTIKAAESFDINVNYEKSTESSAADDVYDLVIVSPAEFSSELNRLVTHKNTMGIDTLLKTTEDIYNEYSGADKPEQIKYFLKDAIESWNITYVLLVGGLNSELYAKPKDTTNYGSEDWHLPVRYSNMKSFEAGYITDLYYADIYKEGGEFDDWDSYDDGIYANWGFRKDRLDMYPDLALGRIACRNNEEVTTLVNKIITYEETRADPSWFEKIIGITGDGFLDQPTLDFEWDTNGLPTGTYTIYAQSNNDEGEFGPIDETVITVDKSQETVLTFNHDDYLLIENYPSFPAAPVAKVTSISNDDILGSTDFSYSPDDSVAYCNYGWANMRYNNGVLTINGKSYDPKLYGNITDMHVWIENSAGETVFEDWRYNLVHVSEGDWTVGEMVLWGRGGALHHMPEGFQKIMMSSSNGLWTGTEDVMNAIDQGAGFLFFSGHGSPHSWGNHYPGVPGNRHIADCEGITVSNIKLFPPFIADQPPFPIDSLNNGEKLPITVIGGCHNSQFNVSGIPSLLHLLYYMGLMKNNHMNTYGNYCPETFSWRFVRNPDGGAIASLGNTGYGFGQLGEYCLGGLDGWITNEFFRQYGIEGHDVLGDMYTETLNAYINEIGKSDDGDVQTIQQWVLLGDPSLKIGGYE